MRKGSAYGSKLRIEFHRTYLVMALGFVLTGYYLNLLVFTSLIVVHELGHYLVARVFCFHVERIVIYPYGGMTKIVDMVNRDIDEELLIATSGVIMQFLFYLLVVFFHHQGLVRDYTMNLFTLYNQQMIFFNLMPIYPLDGSKVVNLILSKYFSYRLSNFMTIVVSFLMIMVLAGLNIYCYNYSNLMIMGLLFTYLWKFYQKRNYLYQRFLVERYLYSIEYPDIKVIGDEKQMYKNKTHVFYVNHRYVGEKVYLGKLFTTGFRLGRKMGFLKKW